jgi:hypothetical protein
LHKTNQIKQVMYEIINSSASAILASRLFNIARATTCVVGALILIGCAHPISIEAKKVPEREAVWSSKKVAYVITDADKQKEVTSPGGGGDKITYYPYRDVERSLRAALGAVFADVSALKSATDAATIKASDTALIFSPTITATSSSPSALTWPPTKFSITIVVDVVNAQGVAMARLTVNGNGAAEFDEFKTDFGLSGRRAMEQIAQALVEEIKRTEQLR